MNLSKNLCLVAIDIGRVLTERNFKKVEGSKAGDVVFDG